LLPKALKFVIQFYLERLQGRQLESLTSVEKALDFLAWEECLEKKRPAKKIKVKRNPKILGRSNKILSRNMT